MLAQLNELKVQDVTIKLHRAGRGPTVLFLPVCGARRAGLDKALAQFPEDVAAAANQASDVAAMFGAVEAVLRDIDILLCASAMEPPCRIDDAEAVERSYPRQARTPSNVTGHPALAMMSGLSSGGLPLSVQFVSRYFAEAKLFQVAREWERTAGMEDKHPNLT